MEIEEETLRKHASARIVDGIMRVRQKRLKIHPGYDGEYGKVELFAGEEARQEKQMELF